jgi:peptidoglycan hydrolase CwlO-like protein
MKPHKYITALLLTISITLSIYAISDNRKQNISLKSTESRLNDTQTKISALERVKIPQTEIKPVLEEIKALVRENENLRQENKDLKTQMEQLGWWKGGR